MRGQVIVHNPFSQAKGNVATIPRVKAKFERRAELRAKIELIDAAIVQACRDQNDADIRRLSADRVRCVQSLFALSNFPAQG